MSPSPVRHGLLFSLVSSAPAYCRKWILPLLRKKAAEGANKLNSSCDVRNIINIIINNIMNIINMIINNNTINNTKKINNMNTINDKLRGDSRSFFSRITAPVSGLKVLCVLMAQRALIPLN